MNAVLDFPSIIEPVAVEKTNAITASLGAVNGEVAKFDAITAGLAAIELAHPKDVIVADIATSAGMKLAEGAWRAYRNPRLEVERARKAAKTPVLALGRAIDEFAGGLETRLREGEDHYKAQIDSESERQAAVKAEAARAEAERIAKHETGIDKIRAYLTRCQAPGMTSERISGGIDTLAGAAFGPEWEEFAVPAANAQCETLESMRQLHAQALGREQEAARQAEIAAENARQAAELARARAALEAEAAEARRLAAESQAKLDAERAEFHRQREEARAAEAAQAAELAAQRAESERLERLAFERRAAEVVAVTITVEPAAEAADAPPDHQPAGVIMGAATDPANAAVIERGRVVADDIIAAEILADAVRAAEPATMFTLGELGRRLGFVIGAKFLADLGIEPDAHIHKAILYAEAKFPAIKAALIRHIESRL